MGLWTLRVYRETRGHLEPDPSLCGQGPLLKRLTKHQGSPGQLQDPQETRPSAEPPSTSLAPKGPVPPQLHGGEQGAIQGPSAAPAPGWVTFGTCQVKCGCKSPLGHSIQSVEKVKNFIQITELKQRQKSEQLK